MTTMSRGVHTICPECAPPDLDPPQPMFDTLSQCPDYQHNYLVTF